MNIWSPILDEAIYIDSPDGVNGALKYTVKTIILIVFICSIILLPNLYIKYNVKYYIRGFITAVFIHGLYSIVQIIFWYSFNEDIHTPMLKAFGVTEESVGHVLVNYLILGVIRPSGIHWDPAYFGLWGGIILLLAVYTPHFMGRIVAKKVLITLLSIAWFLSFSRTGYFAVLMTIIVLAILRLKNRTIKQIKFVKISQAIIMGCVFVGGIFIVLPLDIQKLAGNAITYRFSHDEEDGGSSRHISYPVYTIEGMLHDPVHFIFGYGARNSSRAIYYSNNIHDFVDKPEAFDIESDICKMLANYGFLYFLLYLFFNYKLIKAYCLRCNFKHSFYPYFFTITSIATFFAGFFYMYNDSRWVWIVYLFALIFITRTDLFDKDNYVKQISFHHNS